MATKELLKSEIDKVAEEYFSVLYKIIKAFESPISDAPIKRVNAPDTSVPFSPVMEKFFVPDEEDLIKAVTEIM